MRHRRPITSALMALGLVLASVGSVAAKGGDAIATLDEPLPPGPVAGSTITIGWSLDLRQDDGTTLPFWAEGVFLRFTPPAGASFDVPGRQDHQGHFVANVLVPAGGLGEVAFGMRGDMCSRGTCVASFEFFRVADTTAAEAAAAAALARTQAGRAPAAGQRRDAAVAPAPVAPVAPLADPAADPIRPAPPAPASRTAPSVDGAWLAALMVIGLALAGIVVAARGRGRTSAA